MSSSEASNEDTEMCFHKEYVGIPPPPNTDLPTAHELLDLCDLKPPRGSITLPTGSESPVFWVKYGRAVYWNEVVAQAMAHCELPRLGSPVRAPAVYYACTYKSTTFIVMEHIPGKTSRQRLREAKSKAEEEHVIDLVALSLSELHRIPIPSGSRPAAVDGGRVRHALFSDREAPRHYENVDQIEIHFNEYFEWLKVVAKRSEQRITNLSLEPMVFCHSDLWADNFMIDDTGRAVVIDFDDVSILPSSFAKCALQDNNRRLGFDVSQRVWVPTAEGVDNTQALATVEGRMPIASAFLYRVGQRLPGGDQETQERIAKEFDLPY
ncbi:hypothetical protein CONLIGDRAFT_356658 [Coniochaeta ligniaria NRRL 30616]|uniref:Aminoglycoside phosphotransferase domain-containing protein n=1 Tax=Coniochaeta ligniaria NRRL 30616 TaxID=1408157 RepID=A0A1J7JQN6_9PEZI|nr:hypothetical protein CONLIGDRAFT_356658 [Coniochaeta ligniaria NRRL 30616]